MTVQCGFAYQYLYCTAVFAIKISVLSFYRRIFLTPKFKQITDIIGAVIIAWWIAVIIVCTFSCNPIRGYWNKTIISSCVDVETFSTATTVPHLLTDVIVLLLPIRMIWRLQLARNQKFAMSFIFLLGSL